MDWVYYILDYEEFRGIFRFKQDTPHDSDDTDFMYVDDWMEQPKYTWLKSSWSVESIKYNRHSREISEEEAFLEMI